MMRYGAFLLALFTLLAADVPQTGLPNVDFSGLSPAQKDAALKLMREEGCACGCSMKIAECRVADPNCGESASLARLVVRQVREGKTPDQIHAEIAKRRAAPPRQLEEPVPIPIEGAPARGAANARITLVEFSDFECPYCSKAVGEVESVLRAYPNDVRLVYKQYPLSSHPHAHMAAEASLAANAQGKFWQLHDKMFANFRSLSSQRILDLAREAGLDAIRFQSELQSGKYKSAVDKDVADGNNAFVRGTPTLFVNGRRFNGALTLQALKPVLDAELKR